MNDPHGTGQEVGVKWARGVTHQRVYMPNDPQLDLVAEVAAGRIPAELRDLIERALPLAELDFPHPDVEQAFWEGFAEGARAALLERDVVNPN
jgi:hypothetical protein